MATGDDAAAAGMDLVAGTTPANTIDTEINKTRDYIAQRTEPVVPITKGGTGATTAAAARVSLGVQATVDAVDAARSAAQANTLVKWDANGRLQGVGPSAAADLANKSYVDGQLAGKATLGTDVSFGNVYSPGATAATSSYTVMYIDGAGRFCRGASTERVKDHITPLEAATLGMIFPDLFEFTMKDDPDQVMRVGWIAERLDEHPDLQRFVVYETEVTEVITDDDGNTTPVTRLRLDADGKPIPLSIDFIALFIAQITQLHHRVSALEAGS